jgi:hypothetical protein
MTNQFKYVLLLTLSTALIGCGGGTGADTAIAGKSEIVFNHGAGKTLPACPSPLNALRTIAEVQGEGPLSPLVDGMVTVRGVVIGDYRAEGQLDGFFIQQPVPGNGKNNNASEGIFVYAPGNTTPVSVGDYVQVSGTVEEYKSGSSDPDRLTQIGKLTEATVCGAGPEIKPVNVTLPVKSLAELEALEGMLVRFMQPLYVSETYTLGRFGELTLSPESRLYHPNNQAVAGDPAATVDLNRRSRIVLDDGRSISNPNPIPYLSAADSNGTRRSGDVVKALQGVLTWSFDAYRVQPTERPVFTPANPRPASPAAVGGTVQAGSLNVLNYFTTLNQRGANSAAEFQRQKEKLVKTIIGLNADVLGLMEIENNGTAAIKDLVDAVNAQIGANTYAVINSGVPGTDAIKVAIIYKPAVVRPVGNAVVSTDAGFVVDGGLRPPVAQRFAANANNGSFWFVVNHLKSKGSCPANPASVDGDAGQGCWNAARSIQANTLKNWVAGLTAASNEADVLMVGDFNAYLHEDPIVAIEGGGFENLLKRLPASERYTYVFNGESGALDHAFASNGLKSQVAGVSIWHINADEPLALDYNLEFKTDDRYAATPFRSSDHDPVLVGLNLNADAAVSWPTLDAVLPLAGQAGTATIISNISAMLSTSAASATLRVDWNDGSPLQVLAPGSTTVANVYAAAGTYTVRLLLEENSGKTAELLATVRVSASADPSTGPELFFSEYLEGSSNNKALEIYNPTASAVDLGAYQVKLYANGATTATNTQTLSGSLAAGATLVLVNSGITPSAVINGLKMTSPVVNFNGDDAVTLSKGSTVVDAIGQVGFDPGTEWTVAGVSTLNKTLRRKSGVVRGNIPPASPAIWDVAADWDVHPIDTFNGLGLR